MNSFTLTAVGHLARNPEVVAKSDLTYTKFCLVGNDYAGKDEEGASREVVTSIWFVAFGAFADAIAHHARKGDQLFVEARVRANIWTDKQGEKQYDHSFVVQGFRFGAPGRVKREEREGRHEHTLGLPRGEGHRRDSGGGDDQHASGGGGSAIGIGSDEGSAEGSGEGGAAETSSAVAAAAATASSVPQLANTTSARARAARPGRRSVAAAP